jgi:hypothetical protein
MGHSRRLLLRFCVAALDSGLGSRVYDGTRIRRCELWNPSESAHSPSAPGSA